MDLGIKDKKALITGAGRGIGQSIALKLAEEGAKVAIVSRTESDLTNVLEMMGGKEKGHHMIICDLTEKDGPSKVMENLKQNFGEVDILINNLGGTLSIKNPFCSLDDWQKVYRLNLEVAIELNNLVIPNMQKNQWGRIVNISSIAGMENSGPITYCTMKSALTAYTRSLGRVLAKTGIVMTAIMPGAILTKGGYWEQTLKENPEHVERYLRERCPMQKLGEPDDISTIVAMLCSKQAKYCQGSIFPVDGGQSKHFFWTRDW